MQTKRTIALEGVKIYAYHGVMENERKIGTEYVVNLKVDYDWSGAGYSDSLDGTINYALLYEILKDEMMIPSNLIEHVAQRIVDHIHSDFPLITSIKIDVKKMAPPIEGQVLCSAVGLEVSYSEI